MSDEVWGFHLTAPYTFHISAQSSPVIGMVGWCTRGIPHIQHIHQPMSHLQKIPICIDIGPFVVMYARCTPGFAGYIEISRKFVPSQ